jgi:predicted AAA+ superfamily ATPase
LINKAVEMDQLFAKHRQLLTNLKTRFKRSIYDQLPWDQQMIGITGARGVGKTTLILQYISENYALDKKALYISFDGISMPYENLRSLAEAFSRQGGEHLFIDEIHKYPNWSQELKYIYDMLPDLRVVFTGSSILDIHSGQADLSRRALIFNLMGLSFREFLQIETSNSFDLYSLDEILKNHERIASDINQKVKPLAYFESYLKYGYYPFYLQSVDYYSYRLSATINQIIEADMPALLKIDYQYIHKIKRFINVLAHELPQKPNITSLAAAIEVSWQSIIKYLHYLEKARIIQIIYPAGKKISALAKPEKVFLHHPNLFYVFNDHNNAKGNLREMFFTNQLSSKYKIEVAKKGDFLVQERYTFEIGGSGKKYDQIAGIKDSYIASDNIEYGFGNKIPLWLFGFLY